MHENSAPEACLNLGTLAYLGSPTVGSVIVYSSTQNRWGRVPMQDVNVDVDIEHPSHRLWWLLRSDRVAQFMLMVLVLALALMLVGIGSYGFGKNSVRQASQPRWVGPTAFGEAPRSREGLAMQGGRVNRQVSFEPVSF